MFTAWILSSWFLAPPVPCRIRYAAVAAQQGVDFFVDRRMRLRRLSSCGKQRFDNLVLSIRIATVAGFPECRAEDRSVRRRNIRFGAAVEQLSPGIGVIAEDRVEERRLSVAIMSIDVDSAIEQEPDDLIVPVPGRIP